MSDNAMLNDEPRESPPGELTARDRKLLAAYLAQNAPAPELSGGDEGRLAAAEKEAARLCDEGALRTAGRKVKVVPAHIAADASNEGEYRAERVERFQAEIRPNFPPRPVFTPPARIEGESEQIAADKLFQAEMAFEQQFKAWQADAIAAGVPYSQTR